MTDSDSNSFIGLGMSFMGILAVASLFWLTYGIAAENGNMVEAQENGAQQISCLEIMNRDDMATKAVEVTHAQWDGKSTASVHDGRTTINVLLRPDAPDTVKNPAPKELDGPYVIVMDFSVERFPEFREQVERGSFVGSLSNATRLSFDHIEKLRELYPNIDFERSYALSLGLNGSKDARNVFRCMLVFWGLFLLGMIAWFVAELKIAFKEGVTLQPTPTAPPLVRNFHYDKYHKFEFEPEPIKLDSLSQSDCAEIRTICPRIRWLSKWAALVVTCLVLPILMAAKNNLAPDSWMPWIWSAMGLMVGLWCAYGLLWIWRESKKGEPIRQPLASNSPLPRFIERSFSKRHMELAQLGFTHNGDFRTNNYWNQVTREFVSDDYTTIVRLIWEGPRSVAAAYSLLDNGEVVATYNYNNEGSRLAQLTFNNFEIRKMNRLVAIHRQLIHPVSEFVVALDQSEGDAFGRYCLELEQRSIKKQFKPIAVPQFETCIQVRHLVNNGAVEEEHFGDAYSNNLR